MQNSAVSRFYLSAYTPLGFVSRLGLLCDPSRFKQILLLKGGTGKERSRLIEAVAEKAEQKGYQVKRVASAVNKGGCEAAFWEDRAIIDSAVPYSIEPRFPSAFEEILWLGSCWKSAQIVLARKEIAELAAKETELTEQALRFLNAADALYADNSRMVKSAVDTQKTERQAQRIAQKLFEGKGFFEQPCIFSTCFEALPEIKACSFAENVVSLQDENGICAELLLKSLYTYAKEKGCSIISGYSPFAPYERLEQLILPELSLAFITENERLCPNRSPDRVINARRFVNKQKLSEYKNRLSFNKKAAQQMLLSSKSLFADAFAVRERINSYYDEAFDEAIFEQACITAAQKLI